jgi:hypothetical protein
MSLSYKREIKDIREELSAVTKRVRLRININSYKEDIYLYISNYKEDFNLILELL